jgi:hypothetical protein
VGVFGFGRVESESESETASFPMRDTLHLFSSQIYLRLLFLHLSLSQLVVMIHYSHFSCGILN